MKLGIPPVDNDFYTLVQGLEKHPESYFVFGSNLAGVHGAGAAKDAHRLYGAVWHVGVGFTGMCYAVPTKNYSIWTMPLNDIRFYVEDFVKTSKTSGKHFLVTAVGCGLAGYKAEDIAPLFKGAKNCWFPIEWKPYL